MGLGRAESKTASWRIRERAEWTLPVCNSVSLLPWVAPVDAWKFAAMNWECPGTGMNSWPRESVRRAILVAYTIKGSSCFLFTRASCMALTAACFFFSSSSSILLRPHPVPIVHPLAFSPPSFFLLIPLVSWIHHVLVSSSLAQAAWPSQLLASSSLWAERAWVPHPEQTEEDKEKDHPRENKQRNKQTTKKERNKETKKQRNKETNKEEKRGKSRFSLEWVPHPEQAEEDKEKDRPREIETERDAEGGANEEGVALKGSCGPSCVHSWVWGLVSRGKSRMDCGFLVRSNRRINVRLKRGVALSSGWRKGKLECSQAECATVSLSWDVASSIPTQ